jgi:hypothetical protein
MECNDVLSYLILRQPQDNQNPVVVPRLKRLALIDMCPDIALSIQVARTRCAENDQDVSPLEVIEIAYSQPDLPHHVAQVAVLRDILSSIQGLQVIIGSDSSVFYILAMCPSLQSI